MMNKSNRTFALGTLIFALAGFLFAPIGAANAGVTVSGMIKTQVCDSLQAAEEKKGDKEGDKKGDEEGDEEEPECE